MGLSSMTIRPPLHSTLCLSMIHQLVSTLSIHLRVYKVPWAHQHGCKSTNLTPKLSLFLLFTNYFLLCSWFCCATFNLNLLLILISPKHWTGTPVSGYSLALCHSISVHLKHFPLPSLLCESVSGNKIEVFVFVPILSSVFSSIIYWSVTRSKH